MKHLDLFGANLLFFILTFSITPDSIGQNSLFVNQSVAIDGDGFSWPNAIKEFATALDSAWQNPNIDTIYVAEGIYKPMTKPYVMNAGQTGTPIVTPDPRDVTFHIRTGLVIIGGYASGGSTYDPNNYFSILSGDIGTQSFVFDNTYHVVITDKNSFWTAPNPKTHLTGMYIRHGRATGAGSISLDGNALLRTDGGGVCQINSNLEMNHLVIDSNYANNSGGGIFSAFGDHLFRNTTFKHNISGNRGAACHLSNGITELQECKFLENNLSEQSSDVLYSNTNKLIVNHTEFIDNKNSAINTYADTMIFSNSLITGSTGFFACEFENDYLEISNSVFKNNADPYSYGGLLQIYSFENNPYSPDRYTIKKNQFINNVGEPIMCMASLAIIDNVFIENNIPGGGACINSISYSPDSVYITNNLFYNNDGRPIVVDNGIPIITNNTFAYNKGTAITSGCDITYTSNSIFWKNSIGGQTNVRGVDFIKYSSALGAKFVNNRMQLDPSQYYDQNDLGLSINNIFNIPIDFKDEGNPYGLDSVLGTLDDGYLLVPGSNGINQGNNSYVTTSVDLTGATRIQDGTIDMGAYETDCPSASPRISQSGTTINNQDFTPSSIDSTFVSVDDIFNNPPTIRFTIHNDSSEALVLVGDKISLSNGSIFSIIQLPATDTINGQDSSLFILSTFLDDCPLLDSFIYDTINIVTNSCSNNPYQFAVSIEITGGVLPNLILPNDTSVSCEQLNTILLLEAVLDGDCDSIDIASALYPSEYNCADTLLRVWTITDINDNQKSDTQQIILFDLIAPEISALNDTSINCSDYNQSLLWPAPMTSDNCDTSISISFTDSIIQNVCSDTVYRKWTATDDCGNKSSIFQKIILIDNLAPEFTSTLPQYQAYNSPGNSCNMSVPITVPTLTDLCGDQEFIDISSSDPTVYFFFIAASNIWQADFPIGVTDVTITGNDGCGNYITHDFSIEIIETISPQFSNCPSDILGTNYCDGHVEWQNPTVIDNCVPDTLSISFNLIESYTTAPFAPTKIIYTAGDTYGGQLESVFFCQGITQVLLEVKDASGNMDTCSFKVEIPTNGLNTYYVDQSATGNSSGFNWTNAYTSLEQLLLNQCITDADTIKIADGNYKPSTSDRNFTYSFSGNTVVIGGYSPGGLTFDPSIYETTLNGNAGLPNAAADNLFHVVTIEEAAHDVQLHHLFITRGNADSAGHESGGGILAKGRANFHNIYVYNNRSSGPGSGISIQAAADINILSNSIFQNNLSTTGITFETLIGGKLFIDDEVQVE